MARLPRLSIQGVTQHILQRGNNQLPCFFEPDDYELYLDFLHDALEKYEVLLHAYCLMPNHVHLLMTPETNNGISRVLQDLGRRYVRFINYKYNRSGTLWEGRYHSCLIEGGPYILDCYRYIELNPVRNGIVSDLKSYNWSSYHYNAFRKPDNKLIPHTEYLKLGKNIDSRCVRYREVVNKKLGNDLLNRISDVTRSNRVLGSDNFVCWIENELSVRVTKKKAGRPRKDYSKPVAITA